MAADEKLAPILQNEGFQHVARAIRQSTVTAQYWRNQLSDRRYEVRYGLGQQLASKAHYKDTFVSELSAFMQRYNAENAQVRERERNQSGAEGRFHRPDLTTRDIDEIVALIDQYGSRTVCNLLVAYGYARTPREQREDPQAAEEAVDEVTSDDALDGDA